MSDWPSVKARRVFAALIRIGWRHDRTAGSHKILKKDGWSQSPRAHPSEYFVTAPRRLAKWNTL